MAITRVSVLHTLLIAVLVLVPVSAHRFRIGSRFRRTRRFAAPGAGAPVDSMFIFGDSFWDIGNNKFAIATHKNVIPLNIPPYGLDYVPLSGRCSNGKIIPDFLADKLGFASPPPSYQPAADATKGLNFASAFGTAANATGSFGLALADQISNFVSFRTTVLNQGLVKNPLYPPASVFNSALYVVSLGALDYILALANLPLGNSSSNSSASTRQPFSSPAEVLFDLSPERRAALAAAEKAVSVGGIAAIPAYLISQYQQIVGNITNAAKVLLDNGAHRVLITGVPAFGCTPAARVALNVTHNGCSALANALFVIHNVYLRSRIAELRSQYPDAIIIEGRFFNKTRSLSLSPTDIGAIEGKAACCGAPPPYNGGQICGLPYQYENGTKVMYTVCNNRAQYVYWDFIHPTQAGHSALADLFWQGGKNEMYPYNIADIVSQKL